MYVDTSALGRILLEEPDAPAIRLGLKAFDKWISSRLMQVELRRLGLRIRLPGRADALLRDIGLMPLDETILHAAETIDPPNVATLDAIHLATVRRLHSDDLLDAVMTFDSRLAEGARHHGIAVVAPT